jgi:hypothetical protein
VWDYQVVREGHDVFAPQSYNDVYVRGNFFGLIPSKFAAGVDATFTVPNGVFWDLKSLIGTLTNSAGAANRFVGFFLKDQTGTVVYQYNITAALAASLTATFCFSEDASVVPTTIATTNALLMPQPKAWIPPGWSFGTNTTNIQAGDQWSAVAAYVQEWLPPEGS